MSVRVVSYDILVPKYADRPDYYYKCQPQFLKTEYRWKLIQTQLENEIVQHANTVICLQEMSLTLLPELELFFRRINYSLFHNLYGHTQNGYMGVGIAIPLAMQLNSMSFIKVSDHIRSISKQRESNPNGLYAWGWGLYQYAMSKFTQTVSDPWQTAISRINTLICLQVTIDGKTLWIATYHMPCLYKQLDVMAIHSSIVKDLMFELAGGQDFILAGDFNIKPRDECYKALVEKDYTGIQLPTSSIYDVSYRPNTSQVFKSAYREKNGREPTYTNYVDTAPSPNFRETLDYIFFAGQLKVENVLEFPDQPTGDSYPDETHPSDHLMIAATFQL